MCSRPWACSRRDDEHAVPRAAQQALQALSNVPVNLATLPALAYAVSYPIGVVGIIATLLLIRGLFRIDAEQEAAVFRAAQRQGIEPLSG